MRPLFLTYYPFALVAWICFVFLQSLPYKFTAHPETMIIFNTIAQWMAGRPGLGGLSELFAQYGGTAIGLAELTAVILLLIPKSRAWGAILAVGVMSGAIFFHLFTPLGVVRTIDDAGNTDKGALFMMASSVWLAGTCLIWIYRDRINPTSTND